MIFDSFVIIIASLITAGATIMAALIGLCIILYLHLVGPPLALIWYTTVTINDWRRTICYLLKLFD